MKRFRTVADIINDLSKLPQDLPVLVGCHFDNDDGLTNEVDVRMSHVAHSEDRFFTEWDPAWGGPTFQAVTIS